ncbi:MAG: hypothetical protein J3K34DRAFT_445950 [Monoraphidium minutum]|nr:MAG: hypothetical protein J3K34DRAFT_445950 [Monoraphidium minutum]
MSPSQYLAPWRFAPESREAAARALRGAVEDARGRVLREEAGPDSTMLLAELPIPGGAAPDVLTFKLRGDGIAMFSAATTAGRAPPPFCATRGCISGPAERGRMAALRDALGWGELEALDGEDAVWLQILLH